MDITSTPLFAVAIGFILTFILGKFFNRGDDNLKLFGENMNLKFNYVEKQLKDLLELVKDMKSDHKESEAGFKEHDRAISELKNHYKHLEQEVGKQEFRVTELERNEKN